MIVEDELTSSIILQKVLEGYGYDTIWARNLTIAGNLLEEHDVSLMLLDINLPDGNGIEWYLNYKSNHLNQTFPVLFVTADETSEQKIRGFDAGAVDYITKPFDQLEILARVKTHLRLRAAYERLTELQSERLKKLGNSQKLMMPHPDNLPGASFAVQMKQINHAGGDFYDVVQTGTNLWDYIIADASGHDLDTSLWTATLKALFHEYATVLNTPDEILQLINKSLLKILPIHQFFTILLARVNKKNGTVTLVSAGHPPPIIISPHGEVSIFDQESDILGMFPNAVFASTTLNVRLGTRIFIYTDGLVEGFEDMQEGITKLAEMAQKTMQLCVRKAIAQSHTQLQRLGSFSHDDSILMIVEV
ncbi:MAG: SpoIIE family protein phosphatase [Bacteroidetes bacterium]|nr:SpoIIE family protein phosphatase [Bacteroidota bacterium]